MMDEECNVWYSDDTGFFCNLLKEQWSLGVGETPLFYYDQDRQARQNLPGSIYVYSLGRNNTRGGINYDAYRVTHRICIDIQNPVNRERHFEWMNEVYRILLKFRRAGRNQLNGWDYYEISGDSFKPGYIKYYHDTIEFTLVKEMKCITQSGFGELE